MGRGEHSRQRRHQGQRPGLDKALGVFEEQKGGHAAGVDCQVEDDGR